MSTLPGRSRAAMAAAVAALAASLLAGCVGNPVEELVNQGVEDAVEGATGGELSLDGEIPADFPESVQLIEGDISFAGGTGTGEGWLVVVTSEAADPVADARALLENAGFSEDTTVSGGAIGAVVYSDDQHTVLLAGDGTTVSYTVTPKQ